MTHNLEASLHLDGGKKKERNLRLFEEFLCNPNAFFYLCQAGVFQAGAIRLMSVLVSEKLMAGPNTHYFTTHSPESGAGAKQPLVSCSYMQ